MISKKTGHFLPHLQIEGSQQMALDELLLWQSVYTNKFSIAFRFYSWEGPWLSIGRNQKDIPIKWKILARQKQINIVRRPSGGEAVLHSGGITYALIWKDPPRRKKEAYFQASQWLIQGFLELGLSLKFGKDNINSSSGNCFASSTVADLIDTKGIKRIGSAQHWIKGNVLQHGEILLSPSKVVWHDIFQKESPATIPFNVSKLEIEQTLKRNLFSSFPNIYWENRQLEKEEINQVELNSKNYLFKFTD
tara:strand:- start:1600 stop:2346 length:747 start_codon:yes stop_codon:yes gene_type:complete